MKLLSLPCMLLAVSALGLCSTAAHADNARGFFAGGGISAINVDQSTTFHKADLWMGELFAGYKYNTWLGAELRYGKGLGSETLQFDESWGDIAAVVDIELQMDLNHYRAAYYRAEAINETGRFYGLVGYAEIDYTISYAGQFTDLEEDGLSWGLGFGFYLTRRGPSRAVRPRAGRGGYRGARRRRTIAAA
ncbi:MAG TPA: porin family protein, partial [Cellvibrionaceae bacterium]